MADKLTRLIELHEGRVPHAYQDSLGWWTIGVGHLVDQRKGGKLPDHIIDALLEYDIQKHSELLFRVAPWVKELDEVRQAILIDMTFNMGAEPFDGDGVKDWPKFIAAVQAGNYSGAAEIMKQTLWAKQVKTRAVRLAKMMETGEWPDEV